MFHSNRSIIIGEMKFFQFGYLDSSKRANSKNTRKYQELHYGLKVLFNDLLDGSAIKRHLSAYDNTRDFGHNILHSIRNHDGHKY